MNEVINGDIEKPLETTEQCETNDSIEIESNIVNGIDKLEINGELDKPSKNIKTCDVCLQKSEGVSNCKECLQAVLCDICMPKHRLKKSCLPWRAMKRKELGRCLIASADIQPLQMILIDTAVITIPANRLACLGCGRDVNCRYSCPKCKVPLCGTECPEMDIHVLECDSLIQCKFNQITLENTDLTLYKAVGILRLLRLTDETTIRLLNSLESHQEQIQSDDSIRDELSNICQILNEFHFSREEITKAYGIIKINSYTVNNKHGGVFRSIFPVQSLVAHSCLPNIQYIEEEGGARLALQAIRHIEAGEVLTVRYVPFMQSKLGIAKKLRERWYFNCNCKRCKDGTDVGTFTSSPLCQTQTCQHKGAILLLIDSTNDNSDWICPSCQIKRSKDYVENVEKEYIEKFKALSQYDMASLYTFFNQLSERFHASHHLVMRMAKFLTILQGKKLETLPREQIETQQMLCSKLLTYISRLDPGATQTRAKFLLEKNKADLNLAKRDCEIGKITRKVFMSRLKEGVKVEVNAKKMLIFNWKHY